MPVVMVIWIMIFMNNWNNQINKLNLYNWKMNN